MPAVRVRAVIFTLTLNAAVDEAVSIGEFVLGGSNRCDLDAIDAGGKGINAARVIHRLGRQTIALGFVGGVTGGMLRARLDAEGVLHAFDEVDGLTRLNVMVYERVSGRRSRMYLPGAHVEPARLKSIRLRLSQAPSGGVVVLGGSLPPGLRDDTYAELVGWLHQRGVRAIVDTSGAALARVLEAKPFLVKPNVEEAEELLGTRIAGDDAALAAAREIRRRGAQCVVVSQGADGAVGVDAEGEWKARSPAVEARSTVGSGDSMIAGIAVAASEGGGLAEGLRLGTAAGAATAMVPGTQLCHPQEVERLRLLVGIERIALQPAQM
ncbi:MAG TPA: 1-phosphofructokinase [Verrucomicrobiae bacterium]|nr:1-phosphofructokinase [Verrucomicrobiae bacterium]